jgi:plastocyanin
MSARIPHSFRNLIMSIYEAVQSGVRRIAIASVLLAMAACGGDRQAPDASSGAQPTTPGVATPDPGGSIITVDMVTDGEGNYFEPADFSVRRGDVVRFVLRSGVHNARFVPDSNPGRNRLPPETSYLQLPGQTYDIKIDVDPGTYYYHCDPHALLGMIGHLTVTP